jgi:hypothetical protein
MADRKFRRFPRWRQGATRGLKLAYAQLAEAELAPPTTEA